MEKKLKKVLPLLLMAFCISVLTGCGNPQLSEDELAEILPQEILSYSIDDQTYQSEVSSLEIERRDCDEEYDQVECVINLTDDYTDRVVYAELNLTYYEKGGWQLDSWDTYQGSTCTAKKGPDPSTVQAAIDRLGYNNINKQNEALETGGNSFTAEYDVADEYKYAKFIGTIYYTAIFMGDEPSPNGPSEYKWDSQINSDNVEIKWNVTGLWTATCKDVALSNGKSDRIKINLKSLNGDGKISASGGYYYQAVEPGGDRFTGKEGLYKAKDGEYSIEGTSPADTKLVVEVYTEYPSGTFTFTPNDLEIFFYNKEFENIKRQ